MKKLIAFLLSLACIMSLCACGDDEPTTSKKPNGSTHTTRPSQSVTSGLRETEPAPDDGLVTVYLQESVIESDYESNYKTENSYDENGFLRETVSYRYNTDKEAYVQTSAVQYQYDTYGNLIEFRKEDSRGTIDHFSYQYDNAGKMLLEIRDFSYDGGETIKWHFEDTFTYDENGNLLEMLEIRNGTPWVRYTYSYDDMNRLIEEKYYNIREDEILTLDSRYTYEYTDGHEKYMAYHSGKLAYGSLKTFDEQGNLIRLDYYWKDEANDMDTQASDDYETWTYDAEGRIIEHVDSDWTCHIRKVYAYNDNGDILHEAQYNNHSLTPVYSLEYTYDLHGKRSTVTRYEKEKFRFITLYTYDENGCLAETNKYNDERMYRPSSTTTYTYVAIRVTPERAEELQNG